jgi:hypothetical protein
MNVLFVLQITEKHPVAQQETSLYESARLPQMNFRRAFHALPFPG